MRILALLGLLFLGHLSFGQRGYRIETSTSDTARLQVSWLNWNGIAITDSVTIELADTSTGDSVAGFRYSLRTVASAYSIPVPAGRFRISIAAPNGYFPGGRPVVLDFKPRQLVRLTVRDSLGSLRFRYDGNPKRPVSEFSFTAKQRNTGDTQTTAGSCAGSYALIPANYHVVIGTLPEFQLNTDVDSRSITQIDIPEPGFLQLTNRYASGEVELWSPLGKRFVKFHSLNVSGNQAQQRIRLLPGVYELHRGANVQRFNIASNKDTELEAR